MSDPVLLEAKGIHKKFPGVYALNDVSLQLRAGEVLALLGENGAGKSTLINVLGGVYQADAGEIYIDGKRVGIGNVHESQAHGIAVIHQELVLVPYMTIAENIFLGREPKNALGMVDKKKMNRDAQEIIASVGLHIKVTTQVRKLSVAQQQMVEISKALSLNTRILIMDEPTSSLTTKEVDFLFDTIRRLKTNQVGIIYVSHRMAELFEITDRVSVFRDGRYIDTRVTKDTNVDELVFLMVGRDLEHYYTRNRSVVDETVLEVRHANYGHALKDVSFSLKKGEILGFAGLVGAGRSELMQSLLGLSGLDSGKVILNGRDIGRLNYAKAQKLGIVMVPENRKTQGLVLKNTVAFNLTLAVLSKFIRKGVTQRGLESAIAQKSIDTLSIRTPSQRQKAGNLSGGNQQKVVIGKWLATDPRILILDEPTRGVDVGAKADIYAIMDKLVQQGISIIMISSELNEVINMCDRVLVMANGAIAGELGHEDFSQERIMQLATIGA
ncbi:MAG: sugar ABC transporter ATP-binding protein [Planctomycetota bacterium]|jgi:ABC-type sugar transport system ATPase subunit|nr:sugar ABC transporter ATP-binding protein [Planctomycetota bacterium]